MTTQEKLIKRKLSILELAEYLKNDGSVCYLALIAPQIG